MPPRPPSPQGGGTSASFTTPPPVPQILGTGIAGLQPGLQPRLRTSLIAEGGGGQTCPGRGWRNLDVMSLAAAAGKVKARERVLSAAYPLFAHRGVRDVGIDEIIS